MAILENALMKMVLFFPRINLQLTQQQFCDLLSKFFTFWGSHSALKWYVKDLEVSIYFLSPEYLEQMYQSYGQEIYLL